jgi:hypothetical protein
MKYDQAEHAVIIAAQGICFGVLVFIAAFTWSIL